MVADKDGDILRDWKCAMHHALSLVLQGGAEPDVRPLSLYRLVSIVLCQDSDFHLGMHQKTFVGRAPSRPAWGAHSSPIEPLTGLGEALSESVVGEEDKKGVKAGGHRRKRWENGERE